MKSILLLPLLFIFGHLKNENIQCIKYEKVEANQTYILEQSKIDTYPIEQVLVAIAYHECRNKYQEDRILIMQAVWNRLTNNFNKNGTLLSQQLLAPKQFTGLFDNNLKFSTLEKTQVEDLKVAKLICAGINFAPKTIYYWARSYEGLHYRLCLKQKIQSNTKHIFA